MWTVMLSKDLIWPFFISVLSTGMIYTCDLHFLLLFVLTFYIARRLRVCLNLCHNSKVILTKENYLTDHLLMELVVYLFLMLVLFFCFIIPSDNKAYLDKVRKNSLVFIISLLIWTVFLLLKKLTKSEILYLSSVNDLTLGYGTAIWYYKNYLDRILPENFLMKVRQYESKEGVELPHKLYILCPKSCKVKQYIDGTDYIECSKDLPPYETDHGGIAGRKYNVSVYRIKYNGEFFRCALEYAQPLKTLLALKENGRISLSEMDIARETFIKNLTLMLKDHKNSFGVCELVEFDDEKLEIHERLTCVPSVQPFKRETVE